MTFRRANPAPKPNWTPPGVIWTVHQLATHAEPALVVHIRRMQRLRVKIETLLEERSWSTAQNAEATAILDQLARLGVIYAGDEVREPEMLGDDENEQTSETTDSRKEGGSAAG